MKTLLKYGLIILNFINVVSAHTGSDNIKHGMEIFDWIILIFIIVVLIFSVILVKTSKRKK